MRGLISVAVLAFALPSQAGHVGVLKFSGGTGFVVDGNLLVTALHCADEDTVDCGGVEAKLIHRAPMSRRAGSDNILSDGVAVYRLKGGPYKSLTVAKRARSGDPVYSAGYDAGRYSVKEGVLRAGDGRHYNQTSFVARPGDSGAPIINKDGKVCGVVLASNPQTGTITVGINHLRTAVDAAGRVNGLVAQQQVVVFTTPSCPPCEALKNDIRLGFYKRFNIVNVEYRGGVWSNQQLYDEFIASLPENERSLAFPTVWVRGTSNYRVGYSASRRGGLIGFIGGVLDKLASAVIGERAPAKFPVPPRASSKFPTPAPPSDDAPVPGTSSLDDLKADIAAIKDGSALEKIAAFRSLKGDVASVKADAGKALEAATNSKAELAGQLSDRVASLKKDIEGVRSGNPFLKARAALALKKELPDTINLAKSVASEVKSDIDGVRNLRPESLVGLVGLVRALYRRRREDADAEGAFV